MSAHPRPDPSPSYGPRTGRSTVEFDMRTRMFTVYWNASFDGLDVEKLKRAMTRGDRYELDEVLRKSRYRWTP